MPSFRVEMNYLKVYCNLIRKAENRTPPEGYTEKHHTFPKSIFGKNSRTVVLTAREHYVAHALLEKICIQRYGLKDERTIKMTTAFWCMNHQNTKNTYSNSHLYESLRIRFIENIRGENHHWYGRKHNEETKEKIRKRQLNKIVSEKTKLKLSLSQRGKTLTEETKHKISQKHIGKTLSEEHKKKISIANSGENNFFYSMPFSEEHRNKISIANTGENNGRAKIWIITFEDGRKIKLNSIAKWAKENNYNISCISAVASKRQKYHKDIISIERH